MQKVHNDMESTTSTMSIPENKFILDIKSILNVYYDSDYNNHNISAVKEMNVMHFKMNLSKLPGSNNEVPNRDQVYIQLQLDT